MTEIFEMLRSNNLLEGLSDIVVVKEPFKVAKVSMKDGRKKKPGNSMLGMPEKKTVLMGCAVVEEVWCFPLRQKNKEDAYYVSTPVGEYYAKPTGTNVVDRKYALERAPVEPEEEVTSVPIKQIRLLRKGKIKPHKRVHKEDWARYLKLSKGISCPIFYIGCRRRRSSKRVRSPRFIPNSSFVESALDVIMSTSGAMRDFVMAIPENRRRYFVVQFLTSLGMLINNIYSMSTRPAVLDLTAVVLNIIQINSFFFEYLFLAGLTKTRLDDLNEMAVYRYMPYILDYFKSEGEEPQPNSFAIEPLIRGATLVMSFFITMTTVKGAKPTDTIAMLAKRIRDVKTIVNDSREFVTEMFDIISEILFEQKNATATRLSILTAEAAELNAMPYMQIVRSGKQTALETLPDRITKAILDCNKHEKPTNAIRGLIQLLNVSFSQAVTRLSDFNTVTGNGFLPIKPDPVGVLLVGPKAVGKTSACQALRQVLAEELEYESRNWYQLNKPPGTKHHNTYLGEDIAYVEEFLFNPSKDSILDSFNAIFSSTPYNVAGASLPEKRQFLQSKVVLMNMNKNKNRLLSLDAATTEAIWSRLMWIEMADDKITNNPRFETVTHRRADFSHATFTYKPPKGPNDFDEKSSRQVTFDQLCSMVVKATAQREIEFYERLLNDRTMKFTSIDRDWKVRRIEFLRQVLKRPGPSCDTIQQYGSEPKTTLCDVEPNALTGRSFPIYRFQGPAGSGKTHFINNFANQVSHLTGLPVVHVKDLNKFCLEHAILVLDDLSERHYQAQYIQFINQTHPKSLILLSTNDELTPRVPIMERLCRSFSQVIPSSIANTVFKSPTVYMEDSDLPGFARRAGVGTCYSQRGIWHTIASPFSVTIDTTSLVWEIVTPSGRVPKTHVEIADYCFDLYCRYLNYGEQLPIERTSPPTFEPDILVRANTMKDLVAGLSNKARVLECVLMGIVGADGFRIETKPHVMSFLADKLKTTDFILPGHLNATEITLEHIEPIAVHMARALLNARQGTSLRVACHDFDIAVYDNKLFLPNENQPWEAWLCDDFQDTGRVRLENNGRIIHTDMATVELVLTQDKRLFKTAHTLREINAIRNTFSSHHGIRPQYMKWFAKDIMNRQPRPEVTAPILKYAMPIAALTALFTVVYGIYKFCSKSPTVVEAFIPNHKKFAASRMQDEEYNEYRRALADFEKRDSRAIGDYQGRFNEPAIDRAYVEYFGANALEVQTVDMYLRFKRALGDDEDMQALCKVYKDDKFMQFLMDRFDISLAPNAIDKIPKITGGPTMLAAFTKKVERNVVLVTVDSNGTTFTNHGLGLRDNYVLTVAHSVWEPETDVYKVHFNINDEKYSSHAVLVHLDRSRDFAIIRLLDKSIPAFANITRFLGPLPGFETCKAIFRQYSRDGEIFFGNAVYTEKVLACGVNSAKNFYFTHGQYRLDVHHFSPTQYMCKGDCGLPLFGVYENEMRIIGIHVALGLMDNIFSKVDSTLLTYLDEPAPNSGAFDDLEGFKFITAFNEPALVSDELSTCLQGARVDGYFQEGIECRGSTKGAFTYNQADKRKPHKVCLGPLSTVENHSDFAPQSYSQVEDTSSLYVNKITGEPSIFFSQMRKYGEQIPECIEEDTFTYVQNYLKYYYKEHYGTCDFLSIGEAVNGVQNRNHPLFGALKRMDMSTSAGFVYSKIFSISVKGEAFVNTASDEMPYYKLDENTPVGKYTLRMIEKQQEYMSKGVLCLSAAKACLKQEILPKEKCSKGGTRLFQACDLDRFILRRMLYGTLMAKQALNRQTSASQIGINPYLEFTSLADRLDAFPGEPIFIDYQRFDKRALLRVIKSYADCRFSLLPKAAQTRANRLLLVAEAVSMVRTIQVYNGSIFICNRGTMSGQADTCTQNDYINHFNIVYSLVTHLRDKGLKLEELDFRQLESSYCFLSLGDDGVIATKFSDFTFDVLRTNLKALGQEVTTSGKGVVDQDMFLSRLMLRGDEGLVFPALKQTSIIRQLFFFRRLEPALIAENLRNVLLEAGLWDQAFYEKMQRAVSERLKTFSPTMQRKILSHVITFRPYGVIRRMWKSYIRGHGDIPEFTPPDCDTSDYTSNLVEPNSLRIMSLSKSSVGDRDESTLPKLDLTFARKRALRVMCEVCRCFHGDRVEFECPVETPFRIDNKDIVQAMKEFFDRYTCIPRPILLSEALGEGYYNWQICCENYKVLQGNYTIVGRGLRKTDAKEQFYISLANIFCAVGFVYFPNLRKDIECRTDKFNAALVYATDSCPFLKQVGWQSLLTVFNSTHGSQQYTDDENISTFSRYHKDNCHAFKMGQKGPCTLDLVKFEELIENTSSQ